MKACLFRSYFSFALWIFTLSYMITLILSNETKKQKQKSAKDKSLPYFDQTTSTNITVQLASTAYLPCRIKNLDDTKMVSYIRMKDSYILTVDGETFIADERFTAFFTKETDTWNLQNNSQQVSAAFLSRTGSKRLKINQWDYLRLGLRRFSYQNLKAEISNWYSPVSLNPTNPRRIKVTSFNEVKYTNPLDVGIYECQVSTEPKISRFIHLNVVVPKTKMDGEPEVFVKAGSTVSFRCIISRSLEEPAFIFWYQDNERLLNDERSQISFEKKSIDTIVSQLTIHNTKRKDSGNYSCSPSNLQPANTILHVLNGEEPAAMQHGNAGWLLIKEELKFMLFSLAVISRFVHILYGIH